MTGLGAAALPITVGLLALAVPIALLYVGVRWARRYRSYAGTDDATPSREQAAELERLLVQLRPARQVLTAPDGTHDRHEYAARASMIADGTLAALDRIPRTVSKVLDAKMRRWFDQLGLGADDRAWALLSTGEWPVAAPAH